MQDKAITLSGLSQAKASGKNCQEVIWARVAGELDWGGDSGDGEKLRTLRWIFEVGSNSIS